MLAQSATGRPIITLANDCTEEQNLNSAIGPIPQNDILHMKSAACFCYMFMWLVHPHRREAQTKSAPKAE